MFKEMKKAIASMPGKAKPAIRNVGVVKAKPGIVLKKKSIGQAPAMSWKNKNYKPSSGIGVGL